MARNIVAFAHMVLFLVVTGVAHQVRMLEENEIAADNQAIETEETEIAANIPYSLGSFVLLGSDENEHATNIAIDSSDKTFICGYTEGALRGKTNAGQEDIFVSMYGPGGKEGWTVVVGSEKNDYASAIDTDSGDNVYIAGYTEGNLNGLTSNGHADAFLARVAAHGAITWAVLIGGHDNDFGQSIIIDANDNIFICGYSWGGVGDEAFGLYDAFAAKYDTDGNQLWAKSYGTDTWDYANATVVDSQGQLYIAGHSSGNFGGTENTGGFDIFLMKLDPETGATTWVDMYGSPFDDMVNSMAIGVDDSIFITGYTKGNLDGNINANTSPYSHTYDVFVSKYSTDGVRLWTKTFGGVEDDKPKDIAVGHHGTHFYLTGDAVGDVGDEVSHGGTDIFVAEFDADDGDMEWIQLIGTAANENAAALAVTLTGNIMMTGFTDGGTETLLNNRGEAIGGETNSGKSDAFLGMMERVTFAPTPTPTTSPTTTPTSAPTDAPTPSPTHEPTADPSMVPTHKPTKEPTAVPTDAPTEKPTDSPSAYPTQAPTTYPTQFPTTTPTNDPTKHPTSHPTLHPTQSPSAHPTKAPTKVPTVKPTAGPTDAPTNHPTQKPTHGSCKDGTLSYDIGETDVDCGGEYCDPCVPGRFCVENSDCDSGHCVNSETNALIFAQEALDSAQATAAETAGTSTAEVLGICNTPAPTKFPTSHPTHLPTDVPTDAPTAHPTKFPTAHPTKKPTHKPTEEPTAVPTTAPTDKPTKAPTVKPTAGPTMFPSSHPTPAPTDAPTDAPTYHPTPHPTKSPSAHPTKAPTDSPSKAPTNAPTESPTAKPTAEPTYKPTASPTGAPTLKPTHGSCKDGEHSPDIGETDVDCGGDNCHACHPGKACLVDSDCRSGMCATFEDGAEWLVNVATGGLCNTPVPTPAPSASPTLCPTSYPTTVPSAKPTGAPTDTPTPAPSAKPTSNPTQNPTEGPTLEPTVPTAAPTEAPTAEPSSPPPGECILLHNEGVAMKQRFQHGSNAKLHHAESMLNSDKGWLVNQHARMFYMDLGEITPVTGLRVQGGSNEGAYAYPAFVQVYTPEDPAYEGDCALANWEIVDRFPTNLDEETDINTTVDIPFVNAFEVRCLMFLPMNDMTSVSVTRLDLLECGISGAPSALPTQSPSAEPTLDPTSAEPTLNPTKAPTELPTHKPTQGNCKDGMLSLELGETDVDCGGAHCDPCGAGDFCKENDDCKSSDCSADDGGQSASIGGLEVIGKGTCLTAAPTAVPTESPSAVPTEKPTNTPTKKPSKAPTHAPSETTGEPTLEPTPGPTKIPTDAPTLEPTTDKPTSSPTVPPDGQCLLLNGDTGVDWKHRDTDVVGDHRDTLIQASVQESVHHSLQDSQLPFTGGDDTDTDHVVDYGADDGVAWASIIAQQVNIFFDLEADTIVSGLQLMGGSRVARGPVSYPGSVEVFIPASDPKSTSSGECSSSNDEIEWNSYYSFSAIDLDEENPRQNLLFPTAAKLSCIRLLIAKRVRAETLSDSTEPLLEQAHRWLFDTATGLNDDDDDFKYDYDDDDTANLPTAEVMVGDDPGADGNEDDNGGVASEDAAAEDDAAVDEHSDYAPEDDHLGDDFLAVRVDLLVCASSAAPTGTPTVYVTDSPTFEPTMKPTPQKPTLTPTGAPSDEGATGKSLSFSLVYVSSTSTVPHSELREIINELIGEKLPGLGEGDDIDFGEAEIQDQADMAGSDMADVLGLGDGDVDLSYYKIPVAITITITPTKLQTLLYYVRSTEFLDELVQALKERGHLATTGSPIHSNAVQTVAAALGAAKSDQGGGAADAGAAAADGAKAAGGSDQDIAQAAAKAAAAAVAETGGSSGDAGKAAAIAANRAGGTQTMVSQSAASAAASVELQTSSDVTTAILAAKSAMETAGAVMMLDETAAGWQVGSASMEGGASAVQAGAQAAEATIQAGGSLQHATKVSAAVAASAVIMGYGENETDVSKSSKHKVANAAADAASKAAKQAGAHLEDIIAAAGAGAAAAMISFGLDADEVAAAAVKAVKTAGGGVGEQATAAGEATAAAMGADVGSMGQLAKDGAVLDPAAVGLAVAASASKYADGDLVSVARVAGNAAGRAAAQQGQSKQDVIDVAIAAAGAAGGTTNDQVEVAVEAASRMIREGVDAGGDMAAKGAEEAARAAGATDAMAVAAAAQAAANSVYELGGTPSQVAMAAARAARVAGGTDEQAAHAVEQTVEEAMLQAGSSSTDASDYAARMGDAARAVQWSGLADVGMARQNLVETIKREATTAAAAGDCDTDAIVSAITKSETTQQAVKEAAAGGGGLRNSDVMEAVAEAAAEVATAGGCDVGNTISAAVEASDSLGASKIHTAASAGAAGAVWLANSEDRVDYDTVVGGGGNVDGDELSVVVEMEQAIKSALAKVSDEDSQDDDIEKALETGEAQLGLKVDRGDESLDTMVIMAAAVAAGRLCLAQGGTPAGAAAAATAAAIRRGSSAELGGSVGAEVVLWWAGRNADGLSLSNVATGVSAGAALGASRRGDSTDDTVVTSQRAVEVAVFVASEAAFREANPTQNADSATDSSDSNNGAFDGARLPVGNVDLTVAEEREHNSDFLDPYDVGLPATLNRLGTTGIVGFGLGANFQRDDDTGDSSTLVQGKGEEARFVYPMPGMQLRMQEVAESASTHTQRTAAAQQGSSTVFTVAAALAVVLFVLGAAVVGRRRQQFGANTSPTFTWNSERNRCTETPQAVAPVSSVSMPESPEGLRSAFRVGLEGQVPRTPDANVQGAGNTLMSLAWKEEERGAGVGGAGNIMMSLGWEQDKELTVSVVVQTTPEGVRTAGPLLENPVTRNAGMARLIASMPDMQQL
jgi:hypothetical protein